MLGWVRGGNQIPILTENIPNVAMSTTGGAECVCNRQRTGRPVTDECKSGDAKLYARPDSRHAETCNGKQTVGSLCAHDGRGFNGQDVANDKLIVETMNESI